MDLVSKGAICTELLVERVSSLTRAFRYGARTKPLREAVRAHGLRISETFVVGEVADDIRTRGLLASGGSLWEFEYSPGRADSVLCRREEDDVLTARFRAVAVGRQMSVEKPLISTTGIGEILLGYFADLPDELASKVVAVVPPMEAGRLRANAATRYARANEVLSSELLQDAARINRPQSWELIRYFSFSGSVVVFGNKRDGTHMFAFTSVQDALDVLGECPRFDFYLMDADCSFLFAHDEYDNLFGCGAARTFLQSL